MFHETHQVSGLRAKSNHKSKKVHIAHFLELNCIRISSVANNHESEMLESNPNTELN